MPKMYFTQKQNITTNRLDRWKKCSGGKERTKEKRTTEMKSCENGSARINKGLKKIDCDCEAKRIKARLQIKNKN